jgi:hypothetical protein
MRTLRLALPLLAAASGASAQAPHAAHDAAAHHPATAPAVRPDAPAPAGRTLTITARDYAFEAPDSVAAGLTTVRLVNRGPELHHVSLIRLDDGKTMGDFYAALRAGGPPPRWAHEVGGPNTPVPGGEALAALDLTPGRYVIGCFVPSADGVPHVAKGMARELVVVPAKRAAAAPAPRSTLTLTDYAFTLSRPLVAGRQTVRVRNAAAQSHEVLFVKLAPNKRAADVAAWVEKQDGPPPGAPVGGTTGMALGVWNDVELNLEPGEYAMLCLLPDAKDGKPHVAHGMMTEFTVK